MTPEDEAFNEIERQAKQRMEAVRAQLESQKPTGYLCENGVGHKYFRWKKPSSTYKPVALYAEPIRNDVIEEVAQHIEKMKGFGQDTISSFAIYIRGLKK